MLNKLPISIINYLCFGCDRCKGTVDEVFVYICTRYNIVYLGTKRRGVYFFYLTEINTHARLSVLKDRNMSERINSLTELMERVEECG
jgi:hypothetical protein